MEADDVPGGSSEAVSILLIVWFGTPFYPTKSTMTPIILTDNPGAAELEVEQFKGFLSYELGGWATDNTVVFPYPIC